MSDEGARVEAAPAKVNLRLRVLAREESGYHGVETLYQALELEDRVGLRLRDDGAVTLALEGVAPGALGDPEQNLAVRAARALARATGLGGGTFPGLHIELDKRIPHRAGLGGGSSDAAAVLRGLNALLSEPLSTGELVRVGGGLGADVPFFLAGSPLALGWGRGDRLLPLAPLPAREVVLVLPPGDGIATADAYRALAASRRADAEEAGATILPAGGPRDWADASALAGNDFQAVLEPGLPALRAIRRALEEAGGSPALLSGSGSAVFGVFADEDAAQEAGKRVFEAIEGVRVIRTRTRGGG